MSFYAYQSTRLLVKSTHICDVVGFISKKKNISELLSSLEYLSAGSWHYVSKIHTLKALFAFHKIR